MTVPRGRPSVKFRTDVAWPSAAEPAAARRADGKKRPRYPIARAIPNAAAAATPPMSTVWKALRSGREPV
jgi:hypothetical protein